MGTLSISVPDDLRKKMMEIDEINWSVIARKAFKEKDKVKVYFTHELIRLFDL